jgi:hypothetical protein
MLRGATFIDRLINVQHKRAVIDHVIRYLNRYVGSDAERPVPMVVDSCKDPRVDKKAVKQIQLLFGDIRDDFDREIKSMLEFDTQYDPKRRRKRGKK